MCTRICPVCGKPFEPLQSAVMPFCSVRCKQVDLGRWLGEAYGLPWESEEEPDGSVQAGGDTPD